MMKPDILKYIITNLSPKDPLERVFNPMIRNGKFISPVVVKKEGGTFTSFQGAKFPYPGLPLDKELHLVSAAKGLIPMVLGLMTKSLETIDKNPHEWCEAAREIHRVFTLMVDRENSEEYKARWGQLRDALCLFIQYDDAYRFRFQDAFSEINPDKLKLTDSDKYWFSRMDYEFPGKKEFVEKNGNCVDDIANYTKEVDRKEQENAKKQEEKISKHLK